MTMDAQFIKDIYEGAVGKKYDISMSHFFARLKMKSFNNSSLKQGDRVIVFCCGSGLDFPHIMNKIGDHGSILGVDFSSQMLEKAKKRVADFGWKNVELIQADVTIFDSLNRSGADVGVCTLGMSIIPDFEKAYYNLLSQVKTGGEIIIGDMKLASGWKALFNPITVFLAKRFGGTIEGHQNSIKLISMMHQNLEDVTLHEYFMGAYFYCIGRKK